MTEKLFNPTPERPYFFKNSKRYPGQSLEYLALNNSAAFFTLKDRPHKEGDSMHRHIDFLLSAGDDMDIKHMCPICGQRPVRFLLFRNCSFLSLNLSCCDDPSCRYQLQHGTGDRLIAVKLRNLRQFNKKGNKKKAERIFRQLLFLRPSDSSEKIFQAISSKYLNKMKKKQASFETVRNSKSKGKKGNGIQLDLF
jgi:hypothetical protein